MTTAFGQRVREVIRSIPSGEVVSYGDVAALSGRPGAARAVGAVLSSSDGLPWWRVVNAAGRLVPGKESEQARRLRAEGVVVRQNLVVRAPVSRAARGSAPPTSRR